MITKLSIKNFRGIGEGELELAPLTILLGGNNSGKSTILEALFLAPNPFRSVPYVIGSASAVEVVHAMHETLNSQGYAFLLYNYTANQAEIECKVDGEDYVLLFDKKDSDISVYTKKRGEEDYIGGMDMLSMSFTRGKEPKTLIDNTLLISSKLVKSGYQYLERNWASIIN